ncbi:MAG: class I tRNA ligase family protein, partial [Gemmatimonadales bacterium]
FITEELWQKLPGRRDGELLALAPWPVAAPALADAEADAAFARVQEAVSAIRNIRAEYRIAPSTRVMARVTATTDAARRALEGEGETITRLAQLGTLALDGAAAPVGAGAHAVLTDGTDVFVALEGALDLPRECKRLSDDLARLDRQLAGLAARFTHGEFVARAPAEVVAREREKERAWQEQRRALADKLKALGCS